MGRCLYCSTVCFAFSAENLNSSVHLEKFAQILSHLAYDHGLLEGNCFVHGLEFSFQFQNKFVEIGHIVHGQKL
eukprot:UN27439